MTLDDINTLLTQYCKNKLGNWITKPIFPKYLIFGLREQKDWENMTYSGDIRTEEEKRLKFLGTEVEILYSARDSQLEAI